MAPVRTEQEFPFFLGLARKIVRARAIKTARFLPPKGENRFEWRSTGLRKNRGFAQQNPGFCAQRSAQKYFFRAHARKINSFSWLSADKTKRRNPRSAYGRHKKKSRVLHTEFEAKNRKPALERAGYALQMPVRARPEIPGFAWPTAKKKPKMFSR